MNFFTFLLIIVIAGLAYDLIRQKNLARTGHVENSMGQLHKAERPGTAREADLERELAELRERVKVLERIATDGNDTRALAAEIDRLRDS
jgi:Tfp pilus assembly protein PilO